MLLHIMATATFLFILFFVFLLYILPSLIAYCRGHKQSPAIILLNIFLGWTIIGWLIALLWSVLARAPRMNSGRRTRRTLTACLVVILLFIGLVFLVSRFLGTFFTFFTSFTPQPQDMSWQLSTHRVYLKQPYAFAELPSDTASGAQSSLYVHCRSGFLNVHIGTNLHGQLPGDDADKPVKARHRIGQGRWVDAEWIVKRGGVTYPRIDFAEFVESLSQENANLVVEFETGTRVQFPVWNGYTEMREHIPCI